MKPAGRDTLGSRHVSPLAGPPAPTRGRCSWTAATPRPGRRWLWHGYLGPANVTLLTGQWKAGKTALVAALLARMATGGTLAGLPVRAGRAVVVSEEAAEHWAGRAPGGLRFGDVGFFCRPFRRAADAGGVGGPHRPAARLHAERPIDLVGDRPAGLVPARAGRRTTPAACWPPWPRSSG